MAHLSDTNVLLRWQRYGDPLMPIAENAIRTLLKRKEALYITAQNLIEYWNVSTRPLSANGLGRTPAETEREIGALLNVFHFAPDDPRIYEEWFRLVKNHGVSDVKVHDARLVAVMKVYGITHILTFNPTDFSRYPGITAVHPGTLIASP